jgi:ATP-dependent DNA helicase RecQ
MPIRTVAYRPDYSILGESVEQAIGCRPVLALTATATGDAISAIRGMWDNGLRTTVVRAPMLRSNLYLSVEYKAGVNMQDGQLLSSVQAAAKPCLVFLNSQHRCERKAELIMTQFEHYRVSPFHAGMSLERKNSVLRAAVRSELDVLCCTVAFGMGVNVPVKTVLHWEVPLNLESYVQAIGRAGRDGSDADCVLFWNRQELEVLKGRVRHDGIAVNRRAQNVLQVEQYCDLSSCRHRFIVNHFGSDEELPTCSSCDVCAPRTDNGCM